MTVQIRGVTAAEGGTFAVPAGVQAGDMLSVSLRSWWQSVPEGSWPKVFVMPAGWRIPSGTGWASGNYTTVYGPSAVPPNVGATWGRMMFLRDSDGTEPASYTFSAPGSEHIWGVLVAWYSDEGRGLTDYVSGTNSGPSGTRFQSWFGPGAQPGCAVLHGLSGLGSAVDDPQGFTGTVTHRATYGAHSTTPTNTAYRDFVVTWLTEEGTIVNQDRSVRSNHPGPIYWSCDYTTIYEWTPALPKSGWTGWIID